MTRAARQEKYYFDGPHLSIAHAIKHKRTPTSSSSQMPEPCPLARWFAKMYGCACCEESIVGFALKGVGYAGFMS